MSTYAIDARQLRKSFGALEVVKGIDLWVETGTMLAVLGPNGAGKTTVVRMLSTLLAPDGGTATVNGFDLVRDPDGVRRSIGLTGQAASVDLLLTGRENLVLIGRLHRLRKAAARRRAEESLARFDLLSAADRPVKTYSGGMRRRLDLAASLIDAPPVIFLDEPTTGLDPRSRSAMWAGIRRLLAAGTTILLTTQYLEEADQLADRVVVIDQGEVVADDTPDRIKRTVGAERVELTLQAGAAELARSVVDALGLHGEVSADRISVAVEDSRRIAPLLGRLDQAGVTVESVAVERPTLDDAFLALTGHRTTAPDDPADNSGGRAA